jgi:hypothetical protein
VSRAGVLTTVVLLLVVASPARAQTNLVVRSTGDCPSAEAVSASLWAIRPDREWPALRATIDVVENRLRVSLGADPTIWREVPAPVACADRVGLAALVIAAWSGELPAQATSGPSLPVAVSMPLPVQAAVAKPRAAVFELGGAGFYSTVGGAALGARIEVAGLRREGWWGVRAAAAYQSAKSRWVDIGMTDYSRTLLGAALVLQWSRRYLYLSSDWGMTGALTRARGNGYSQNDSASGLNLGLDAEARLGLRLRAFRIWVDGTVYRWLGKQTIRIDPLVSGSSTLATLPSWDLHLGLGAGVMFD